MAGADVSAPVSGFPGTRRREGSGAAIESRAFSRRVVKTGRLGRAGGRGPRQGMEVGMKRFFTIGTGRRSICPASRLTNGA